MHNKEKRILLILAFANFIVMALFFNQTIFHFSVQPYTAIPTLAVLPGAGNELQTEVRGAGHVVRYVPSSTENPAVTAAVQPEASVEQAVVNPVQVPQSNNVTTFVNMPVQPVTIVGYTSSQNPTNL